MIIPPRPLTLPEKPVCANPPRAPFRLPSVDEIDATMEAAIRATSGRLFSIIVRNGFRGCDPEDVTEIWRAWLSLREAARRKARRTATA